MKTFISAVALVLSFGSSVAHAQSGFQVVVNSANSLDRIPGSELARIFLRQQTSWRNGTQIVPVDLSGTSSVREKFSEVVFGKSTAHVKAHWQREVFLGKTVPPAEQRGDRDVISFVVATPGAIGYVSSTASIPAGVRVVAVGAETSAIGASDVFQESDVQRRPELVTRPPVRYPARQMRDRQEGLVTVQFIIDQRGRVESNSIKVLESTARDFEAPALEAVRRSSFRPAQAGGQPVSVRVQQTVRFNLAGN